MSEDADTPGHASDQPQLIVPDCIASETKDSIHYQERHLRRAVRESDAPAMLTAARSLCEAVGKGVLNTLGVIVPGRFPGLISATQNAIDRRPADLSDDEQLRTIAQSLQTIAVSLGEVRNEHGDAHGAVELVQMDPEIIKVGAASSLMWARWVLARVEDVEARLPRALINELHHDTFYGGTLAQRLEEVDLDSLESGDQHALGVAVGQRAARQTFVVYAEGVDRVVNGEQEFPTPYVRGLLEGLLVDRDGRVRLEPQHLPLAGLAQLLGEQGPVAVNELAEGLSDRRTSLATSKDAASEAIDALQSAAESCDSDELQAALRRLAEAVRTVFDV